MGLDGWSIYVNAVDARPAWSMEHGLGGRHGHHAQPWHGIGLASALPLWGSQDGQCRPYALVYSTSVPDVE